MKCELFISCVYYLCVWFVCIVCVLLFFMLCVANRLIMSCFFDFDTKLVISVKIQLFLLGLFAEKGLRLRVVSSKSVTFAG